MIHSFFQEIDELLSGSLTQEDEDAVLQELEEMTQVKCYTSWANKSIRIKTSIVLIFGWQRRNFPPTSISPQYNAPSSAKQTHARMWCIGVYTVGSCQCLHRINIKMAECNLGKVKLETMLASCLFLEFTEVVVGLCRGIWDFTAMLLRSSHFARVLLLFISAPFPALPLVSIG